MGIIKNFFVGLIALVNKKAIVTEPPRQSSLSLLKQPFQSKIKQLIANMTALGYDPIPFETLRTLARQKWLYAYGRTRNKGAKPITWTMHSEHLTGNACDIISKSKGWNYSKFFVALDEQAHKLGLYTIPMEQCHIQVVKSS